MRALYKFRMMSEEVVLVWYAGDSNDYEDWIPHQHNDDKGCLLGSKETFRRLKADSW